jgi:hypothetical protein
MTQEFLDAAFKRCGQKKGFYEFEARFGDFDGGRFAALEKRLTESSKGDNKHWRALEQTEMIDFFVDGTRYTVPNVNDSKVYRASKELIMKNVHKRVKYVLSLEKNNEKAEDSEELTYEEGQLKIGNESRKVTLTRYKKRTTFPTDQYVKVDMTKVTETNAVGDDVTKYEVELEIECKKLSAQKNKSLFLKLVDIISQLSPNYEDIIRFYNYNMTNQQKDTSDTLIYGTVARARDLKMADLVPRGILKGYSVSLKADGEYRFLVFHKTGVWLLYPKNIVERLGDLSDHYPEDTIIAGELIDKKNLKEGVHVDAERVFVPFDVTMVGGRNVSNSPYPTRVKLTVNILKNDYLKIGGVNKLYIFHKSYHNIVSSGTFYESIATAFSERSSVIFKDDGLMFTPNNSPYIADGSSKNQSQRILSNYSDICKWKPPDKQTLDFLYEYNGGDYILKHMENRKLVEFRSTKLSKDFEFINLDKVKMWSGSVVEFAPVDISGGKVTMKPIRMRGDKPFPNDYDILEVGYSLMRNPVHESTLMGEDTVLMRRYHNSLKRKILTDSSVKPRSVLIDFGSGKGGDLQKWSKFSKVLAIEPNPEFIQEMSRRIDRSGVGDKVTVLHSRGEEKDKILDALGTFLPENMEDIDVYVSFMFSLTFFWKNDDTLTALTDTLEAINEVVEQRDGQKAAILFATIDGRKTKALFSTGKRVGETTEVKLNTIHMSHTEGTNAMDIMIDDSKTVATQQTEYFVHLDDFLQRLNYVTKSKLPGNISGEYIMSEAEDIYTSLVIYGKAMYDYSTTHHAMTRLYVSTSRAIVIKDKHYLVGDDATEQVHHLSLGNNIFRIATIDSGVSLQHSILKLISKDYIDEDASERYQRCNRFIKTLNYNLSLENISGEIGCTIIVHTGNDFKHIGDFEHRIHLLQHTDGTYEPLVQRRNGSYCSIFVD